MSDDTVKAAVLRIQAEGLRRHANRLDAWALEENNPMKDIRELYEFARDAARTESDRLEEQANELEDE